MHLKLIPVAKHHEVFRLRPSSLIFFGYRWRNASYLFGQTIKVETFRWFSCFPHVFHALQAVYVILEDLLKDFARKVLGAYGLSDVFQGLGFLP